MAEVLAGGHRRRRISHTCAQGVRGQLVGESSRTSYEAPNRSRFDPTQLEKREKSVFANLMWRWLQQRGHEGGLLFQSIDGADEELRWSFHV
jgi:hypothetical protein